MDLLEIFDELGISYKQAGEHEHVRTGWVGIDCPYCSKGWDHYRLGISLDGPWGSCWSCGSVKLWDVLVEITNDRAAVAKLLKRVDRTHTRHDESVRKGKLVLPPNVGPMADIHREYLKQRGFDPEKIEKLWSVGGIGLSYRLKWSLFLPIYYRGQMVSWTTRTISERKERRYISAGKDEESLPHRSLLYGHDFVRHTAVVVEGPLDAWAVGPGAVATLGIAYTQAQVNLLSKIPNRVVVYDSTEEGRVASRRLCEDLEVFEGRTFEACLETGKDPAEASKREIRKLRRYFLGE